MMMEKFRLRNSGLVPRKEFEQYDAIKFYEDDLMSLKLIMELNQWSITTLPNIMGKSPYA